MKIKFCFGSKDARLNIKVDNLDVFNLILFCQLTFIFLKIINVCIYLALCYSFILELLKI